MSKITSLPALEKFRQELATKRQTKKVCICVCSGTGCLAAQSGQLAEEFAKEVAAKKLEKDVMIRRTGCYGFCERGPIVVIEPADICCLQVKKSDVPVIVAQTTKENRNIESLFYHNEEGKGISCFNEIPFYKHQKRVLLHSSTLIDPQKIDDYIAIGGYSALAKAMSSMKPLEIVEEVKRSGLRGRGGAGFPTGTKWAATAATPGDVKYVVVNGDEGDPGAYMDRSLLEGNPHSILEGLLIGAYAIGATQGFIYVRQEYPLAVENASLAIEQAREYGLLGKNILGTNFSFEVTIHRGAGAFVSGESSALLQAIEGHVGQPRLKYIRTSVRGLWEKPTVINNVETWANVPLIINHGAKWYSSMGTQGSTGTKIFSLVGKIKNSGLVEVPMGITLREIVYKIGGGVPNGKKFKAIQTGGPSGGFLPEEKLDLPVDFDELTKAGAMMGSGGMIVMDEDNCIVNTARYYVNFLAHESCGQCAPCREGLRQMLSIFDRLVAGKGQKEDLALLEELSELLEKTSLCGLGQSAANPVMSALKYFRLEFEAHIEKKCPAKACQDLIEYQIDKNKCTGCTLCKPECPTAAIVGETKKVHAIEQSKCIKCGNCQKVCPKKFSAIDKVTGVATAHTSADQSGLATAAQGSTRLA